MKKYKTISICHLAVMAAIILSLTSQTMAAEAMVEVSFEHPHNMIHACSLITKFSQECVKVYEKMSIINPAQSDWAGFNLSHVVKIRMFWLGEHNPFLNTVLWLQANGNSNSKIRATDFIDQMDDVIWARGINIDKWDAAIKSISKLHSEVINACFYN